MKVAPKTVVLSFLVGTPIVLIVGTIVMIVSNITNYQNRQLLCDAINEGNATKATQLLMEGENPNKKCEISISPANQAPYSTFGVYRLNYPISVAVWRGNDEILRLLIKKGAAINMPDAIDDLHIRKELSPLNAAVRKLHTSSAEILLENEAEPNPGRDLIEEIEAGIMYDGGSTFYESPDFKTQRYEEQERKKYRSSAVMKMLDLLISHKLVNLNDHSRDNKFPIDNPLNSAVGSGYLSLVKLLLSHGFRGPVLYSRFPSGCSDNGTQYKSLYPYEKMEELLRSKNIRILETNSSDTSLPGYYRDVALNLNRRVCP